MGTSVNSIYVDEMWKNPCFQNSRKGECGKVLSIKELWMKINPEDNKNAY
jgi:hypothetical protein